MNVEVDAQGIPYDEYWVIPYDIPVQIKQLLAELEFPVTKVFCTSSRLGHPWIYATAKGFRNASKQFSVGVMAFANKDDAVEATRKRMQNIIEGLHAQEAAVQTALERLKRFAHVRREDDCCEYEDRDFNGGCRTCGDPCL